MSSEPTVLCPPLSDAVTSSLRAGDQVRIRGTLYVARDAAHKRLVAALAEGRSLPFDPVGQIIYYMGPSPARPGKPIGSAGPTTSYRMDPYTLPLLQAGIKALIGKGGRGPDVVRALCEHKALYLVAVGGAGALLAQTVQEAQVLAYPELGAEAVRQLQVVDFPAIVGIDTTGSDIYELGRSPYRRIRALNK
jgi:fumarate hydratase subunit beta